MKMIKVRIVLSNWLYSIINGRVTGVDGNGCGPGTASGNGGANNCESYIRGDVHNLALWPDMRWKGHGDGKLVIE